VWAFRVRRVDLLLPAALAVIGVAEIATSGYRPVAPALATYVVAAVALSLSGVAPLVPPLIVTSIYGLTPLSGFDVSQPASWLLLIGFACFGTGLRAEHSRRLAGLASVLTALAITFAGLTWLTDFEPDLLFGLIITVGPWALGVGLREALDRQQRAGADAERARVEGALAGERAAAAERERIAVEFHDLLAHALGAMVVQSSAAADLVRRDPGAAARALNRVAQVGREALGETGRLLRLLRDSRDELGLGAKAQAAAAAGAPPRAERTLGLPFRDCLLPALIGLVAAGEIVAYDHEPLASSLVAYWLVVLLLCARRAVPLAMPLGVTGILIGARLLGAETDGPSSVILVGALASFSAGRHAPRSRALFGLASILAATAALLLEDTVRGELSGDAVLVLALAVAPWAVGIALRETLARTHALAADAERARLEQELAAERAAAAERKRIARELHDVLANSLSVMTVQASLAADLVLEHPDHAEGAVAEVERSGRAALGETGRLLRLIGDRGKDGGTQPQHRVADVQTLAAEYARAGLTIDLELEDVEPLSPARELSVYRVVQEGLTNALKHAPGSTVRVRLVRRSDGVAVEIENSRARSNGRVPVASGHGLVGLRERVRLFGGSLEAQPNADGGFLLTATIPLGDGE
jgi:signal transduction histidine kinase